MPFREVLQLLLCKSVKSLQLVLNEWVDSLEESVSASAFSQARNKLCHTAFIELLEKCVVEVMYRNEDYRKFKGHRLLAIDGTTLRVPNTKETRKHFGLQEYLNGKRERAMNRVEAKATVLYDILNRIPVSAHLSAGRTNDAKASKQHLVDLTQGDIVIADRAFGSYAFFADVSSRNADFIVRCKQKTFNKYHRLEEAPELSDTTTLISPSGYVKKGQRAEEMSVRFIKVILPNNEVEILATSLLDADLYPESDFKELYRQRWGIETYFQILKSRLCIDNFSGKSVEAVYQDFFSTIFLSGLETIITEDANEILQAKDTKNRLQVNKAVSFHTIKNKIIRLMNDPPPDLEQKIALYLTQTPTSIRPDRVRKPRNLKDLATVKALNFQRYARKHVF